MLIFLWMGLIIGLMLFLSKLGTFCLIFPKSWRRWMHKKPLVQGILDIAFGMSAIHIITLAGGSLVAMISMVTFGCCSMGYIMCHIAANKITSAPTYQKLRYYHG